MSSPALRLEVVQYRNIVCVCVLEEHLGEHYPFKASNGWSVTRMPGSTLLVTSTQTLDVGKTPRTRSYDMGTCDAACEVVNNLEVLIKEYNVWHKQRTRPHTAPAIDSAPVRACIFE